MAQRLKKFAYGELAAALPGDENFKAGPTTRFGTQSLLLLSLSSLPFVMLKVVDPFIQAR